MKKVYLLLFAMGMFTFVACNMGEQEAEETSTEVEVETPAEAVTEQLVDHVCNDKCTDAGCVFLHGEKGHTCSAECEAKEGEEHPKGDDESTEG